MIGAPATSETSMRPDPVRSLAAIFLLLAPTFAAAALENKWRLQFSGNAESDGVLVLAIDPWGRPPLLVRIPILAGTSENGVARAVRDALREAVGEDYRVELDDGEDVLVKRRLFRRRFDIDVEQDTVRGVRVNPDQE